MCREVLFTRAGTRGAEGCSPQSERAGQAEYWADFKNDRFILLHSLRSSVVPGYMVIVTSHLEKTVLGQWLPFYPLLRRMALV